jgi:uncharacterized protein YqgC (DUF456 family)
LPDFLSAYLADSHLWAFLAAVPFITIGFAGIILPVLPGTVLVFVGFLLYGTITGFDSLDLFFFLGQLVLVGLSYLIDFLATALGAKMYGGSKAAVWGAVLGSLMIFVIGPLGLLVGPLAGAVAGEIVAGEQLRKAMRSGWGTFLGLVGGTLLKLFLCALMIGWFVGEIL